MLDLKNIVVSNINKNIKTNSRFVHMKSLMDTKMASYLRFLGTKNSVNRASDYHYLCLAVSDSTEPVNGMDYIHPSVKPAVDYATAVITKGLISNGTINFDFVPENERDDEAARQATNMVSRVVNEMNDPHFIIERWVMDAAMHKNGMMMIKPIREQVVRYIENSGTLDQLKAFELQAEESGLTVLRQSRRKERVDMEAVIAEMQQALPAQQQQFIADRAGEYLTGIEEIDVEEGDIGSQIDSLEPDAETASIEASDEQQDLLNDSFKRNTIYRAKYKLTGWGINIKFHPIQQHYWICDPTVPEIKDQPFCGFFDTMSIAEATELYPGLDLEEFTATASYSEGVFEAGSQLNNLAIHARDSVPTNGVPVGAGSNADPNSRQVTVVTVWNRYDVDNDGELELVELIYSGDYVISAREVEFIPVANMCPKPLPGNFYGMSIAESVIPMQEYLTAAARAEIQLGLLTATPRIGVKPDRVDFEMIQDGESAIFILDSKFDPSKDIYQMPPPSGNLAFLETAMQRIQQDTMAMIGMTQPTDVFNPEVMAPGNSGVKLQMALTPNQIIQDNTVRNAAEGLKQSLWLVWRTLIQYGDDYGVKKLASECIPSQEPVFLDYMSWDDMNFCDRKQIHLELALGMLSEENALARLQIIRKAQTELYATTQQMAAAGTLSPEIYQKIKRPFADTLYVLGVKDCDTYLPSDDEVGKMIASAEQAAKTKTPSPDDQKKMADAELAKAKTAQVISEVQGTDPDTQLNYMDLAMGRNQDYGH